MLVTMIMFMIVMVVVVMTVIPVTKMYMPPRIIGPAQHSPILRRTTASIAHEEC